MDTVILNGKVYSVHGDGKDTAVAIENGKISKVGSDEEIKALADQNTKVIDAKGNTVMPAFVDAHMHPNMCTGVIAAHALNDIVRQEGESRDAYIERMMTSVGEYVKANPDKDVILVTGWYPAAFTMDEKGLPTKEDIDRICPDKPVIMRSFDYHAVLVNSKAIEMSGITKDTPSPRGGMIEKGPDGELNGNFTDITAIELLLDSLECADFTVEQYEQGIMAFQNDYALPNGVAYVFDAMARPNAIKAYHNLAKSGRLKIKFSTAWVADAGASEEQFDEFIANKGKYDVDGFFHIDTVKFFMDSGMFGFMTNEPFDEDFLKFAGMPLDYCGEAQWTAEELNRIFLKLSKAGYQIHVHCMGDGAVKFTLDAFEYVDKMGVKGNRNVITHIMNISDEDVERMARLDVIAAMQPSWPIVDSLLMCSVIPMFGKKRSYEQYPLGRLHDAGVMVTCSTDFPVTLNMYPFLGIQCGMTRTIPKSHPEYEQFKGIISGMEDDPERDCMTFKDLVDGYTYNGAYQLFAEGWYGSLESGKCADVLILDKDMFEVEPMGIENIGIDTMIVNGEIVR